MYFQYIYIVVFSSKTFTKLHSIVTRFSLLVYLINDDSKKSTNSYINSPYIYPYPLPYPYPLTLHPTLYPPQILPYYVSNVFADWWGFKGFFLALLYSGALSSVSSSLSGAAANTWTDFIKPHISHSSESKSKRVNQVLS